MSVVCLSKTSLFNTYDHRELWNLAKTVKNDVCKVLDANGLVVCFRRRKLERHKKAISLALQEALVNPAGL